MSNFFMNTFLPCSITMTVVSLILIIITPLINKRYSLKWQYYTWIIILIGFIIPWRPYINIIPSRINTNINTTFRYISNAVESNNNAMTPNTTDLTYNSEWFKGLIGWVWILVMISVIGYYYYKHYCFIKTIKRWSIDSTDEEILSVFDELKNSMGLSNVKLKICSCNISPMSIGFFKPIVLLPCQKINKNNLVYILKHELVHIKRKDLWLKFLVLIGTSINWFNPLIFLVAHEINAKCESSCDEEVLNKTSFDIRKEYSLTIVNIIQLRSKTGTILSTNFYGGIKSVKKRLISIMDAKKKKEGVTIFCGLILVIAISGCAYNQKNKAAMPSEKISMDSTVSIDNSDTLAKSKFDKYKTFGLNYDEKQDRLYYDNKLVRVFEDKESTSSFYYEDGDIDVYSIVDNSGKLIDVKAYGQDEFKTRTSDWKEEITNKKDSVAPGENGINADDNTKQVVGAYSGDDTFNNEEERRDNVKKEYAIYEKYGLTYNKDNDSLYYDGKLVKSFQDVISSNGKGTLSGSFSGDLISFENEKGEIDIKTARDSQGELTGIEEYKK